MKTIQNTSTTVGLDTGKAHLDIFVQPQGEAFRVRNNQDCIADAVARIQPFDPERVVIEATGRLEAAFVCAAQSAGLSVVVANPTHVRRFAQATGRLAKTDKLDAYDIAHYGEALKPHPTAIQDKHTQKIRDLLSRRTQLMEMRTMAKNRVSILPKALHISLNRHIKQLSDELSRIDKALDKAIAKVPAWTEKVELLTSVNGVGKVLAYTLLSDLPELGTLDRQSIASLVGVAPMNNESGARNGKRRIRAGRTRVRNMLYMAIMSAIQSNPVFKARYETLKANGKPPKVAMVACMRKLITTLNVTVKTGQHWNPETA